MGFTNRFLGLSVADGVLIIGRFCGILILFLRFYLEHFKLMAKVCVNCGKGSIVVGKRKLLIGHYNPLGKRRVYPNLQWTVAKDGKRIKVCAQCLKTLSGNKTRTRKTKAVASTATK